MSEGKVADLMVEMAKDPELKKLIVDWTNRQSRMPRRQGEGQKGP